MKKRLGKDIDTLTGEGFAVFPLRPNSKKPLSGTHGCKDATADPKEARELFSEHPDNANIGVATGSPSGVVVVDIDVKNGQPGEQSLAKLKGTIKGLTATATVQTPSGGLHLYNRYSGSDIRNSTSKLAPGIDVRGEGGYVVAPRSVLPAGDYEWVKDLSRLRDLPKELSELLLRAPATLDDRDLSPKLTETVHEGRRNDELFRTAIALRNQGLAPEKILAAVLEVNRLVCDPPLPRSEVKALVASAAKGKSPPASEPFVLEQHFERVSRMMKRDIEPVSYLFDDLIARGATSILGGPPKGLKSTLMMWLALVMVGAVESDWPRFRRVEGDPLRVGYLDLEQADPLFVERLCQFEPEADALKRLFRINEFPKFDADGVAKLDQLIVDKRLDAVFVDTLARVRPAERGRSASVVDAELLDPVTKISHRRRCHIMVGAHNGKRKDHDNPADMLAATSALSGAVDDLLIIFKPPLAEHELRRNLFVTGRHVRAPGTYVIDRTNDGFNFIGEAADVLEGALQKHVLAVLRSRKAPATPTEIARILGKQRMPVQKVLPKLLDRRLIVATGDGSYESLDNAMKRRR